MSAIAKVLAKAKGNPVLVVGTIIGGLALAFLIGIIAGAILIFGLNLMGFAIPYTMKTMIGAAIIISCLRSMGSGSK